MAYDPAYAYELAVIIQDGIRRMYENREDIFYYLTVMNENYAQPPMPEGAREGILRGLYKFKARGQQGRGSRAQLLGSGAILNEARQGAGAPRRAVRRGGGRLVRHQLQGTASRRARGGALERAASDGQAAGSRMSPQCLGNAPGPDRRRLGLPEGPARLDLPLDAAQAPRAGHGRLRPQRRPRRACAISSRWTRATSRWRRSRSLARRRARSSRTSFRGR